MNGHRVGKWWQALALACSLSLHPALIHAQNLPQSGANYDAAREAFGQFSRHDRNEIYLMLMATGDFNAMASDQFGHRLYNAVAAFQAKQGLFPNGVLSGETVTRLRQVGGRVFNSWQFGFLDHPTADASVVVPNHFGLLKTPSPRGWTLEDRRRTMSIDFSFFGSGEASLPDVFMRMTSPRPGRRIDMQVIKSDFFALAGGSDSAGFYSRYIPVSGGVAGFTMTWNTVAYPNAGRIATVMANELYAQRMNDTPVTADLFDSNPGSVSPPTTANGLPSGTTAFSEDVPMSSVPDPIAEAEAKARADQAAERVRAAEQAKVDAQAKIAEQQAANQELRKQAEAQAQAAREEAAANLRKQRFEKASAAAKQVIDEASAFVKGNPTDPKILDYVQQIADLNSTLSAGDPDETEGKIAALSGSLQGDAEFAKFRTQRAEQRQRQIARDLGDAVHTLAAQRQFLIAVVTRDPTSGNAVKVLPLIKQAEGAIATPDLDRVQTLVGEIDAALQAANLATEFATNQKLVQSQASSSTPLPAAAEPDRTPSVEPPGKTSLQLAGTDKNAFLLKGDLQDIVLLFNTSNSSPHVVRNLRGDIVFKEDRADVCLFGRGSEDEALGPVIKSALASYATAKTIVLAGDPCSADRLASYDVVATRRGTFLRQDPQSALALIKALELGDFQSLVTVTDAQVKAAASAEAVTATEIAADVDKGVKDGFGLLMLTGGSPAICVVAQDSMDAHRHLLASHGDKLATDMGVAPTLAATSADGAFVNSKHGQCGAIYAQAADLKELAGALKRDGVAYRFSPVWISTDEVKTTAANLQEDKDDAERQAADRQRRQADEQHLASLRAADDASKLVSLQAASRDKYGATANAAQAKIAQDVKDFTDHPGDDDKLATRLFPAFAAHYREALANRWELMSENATLEDYGMSDFKGRSLATPFSRIEIELKNRMLGDYRKECFIFGDIEDDEFSMMREPLLVSCDDETALSQWKSQHTFRSVWTLQ